MTDDPKTLVGAAWLAAHLDDPGLRILDASWHMPAAGRDARAEYAAAHIPGAQFFDIDAVADPDTDLPHMLPTPEAFARAVAALGIGDGDQVVIYDDAATRSAARAWWTFRAMGHDRVAVLDGGLGAWRAGGRALTDTAAATSEAQLTAQLRRTGPRRGAGGRGLGHWPRADHRRPRRRPLSRRRARAARGPDQRSHARRP